MELGQKIQQILQHHPSVYVNGLGVFKHIHQASTYDEQRHVFLPPVDYIEFDAVATEGKDLVAYLCEESGVPRSEAEETIRQAVDKLKHALTEYGRVGIDSLGELIRHGEGFVFKALDLSAFQSDPVENTGSNPLVTEASPVTQVEDKVTSVDEDSQTEQVVEEPVGIFNAEEVVEDAVPTVVANEEVSPVEESTAETIQEEEYGAKSNTNRIWYAVLATVGLLIAGTLWYINRETHEQVRTTQQAQTNAVQNTAIQPTVTDTTGAALALDTGLVQAGDTPRIREEIIPSDHTWYIVIASRLSIADAEEIQKTYNGKGHNSVRVLPNRSNSHVANVIWDSYVTKEEADSALRYVRRNHVSDAWHTTVKK